MMISKNERLDLQAREQEGAGSREEPRSIKQESMPAGAAHRSTSRPADRCRWKES